jgi:hypothetical protein
MSDQTLVARRDMVVVQKRNKVCTKEPGQHEMKYTPRENRHDNETRFETNHNSIQDVSG